jgi:hypothetical protein
MDENGFAELKISHTVFKFWVEQLALSGNFITLRFKRNTFSKVLKYVFVSVKCIFIN